MSLVHHLVSGKESLSIRRVIRPLIKFAAKPLPEKSMAVRATLGKMARNFGAEQEAATALARCFVKSGLPERIFFLSLAPGDDLLCTIVLRELQKRIPAVAAVVSNHPSLFKGNDDAAYVLPTGNHYSLDRPPLSTYRRISRFYGGIFTRLDYASFDGFDQSAPPERHIAVDLCAAAGITGAIAIRPYVSLTEEEKHNAEWARQHVVIQSTSIGRHPMANKQWYPERFQGVVDALCPNIQLIQLGSSEDPPLQHVTDLRGMTSLRESAAILYNARLYIGNVGFLMHLARSVDCPAVIVFGGREAPWQSGYICNKNIYSPLACAPCWRWNSCNYDRRCMKDIPVERVASAAFQMLDRARSPLSVEVLNA